MIDKIQMFIQAHANNHATHSVLGGSITALLVNINLAHTIDTLYYAGIGTIFSFVLSLVIKKIFKNDKKD